MLILSYFCVFVNISYISNYNLIKYACIAVVGVYIVLHARILKRKEFLQINVFLLAFAVVVLYASWINRGVIKTRDPFLSAIVFLAVLTEFYLLMEITAVKGYAKNMINAYFRLTVILVILMDVMAISGIQAGGDNESAYLLGTKFHLVYAHFFLVALYTAKSRLDDLRGTGYGPGTMLLIGVTLVMSLFTGCTTGLVGVVVMAVMLVIYNWNAGALHKPPVFMGVLLASFAMSFLLSTLLLWDPFEYIVVQLLGKDITLTSRTKVFLTVPLLLKGRYLLGYGYGTTYELGQRLGGFPNTQNALWEWIWQCGVLGTILLLFLIFSVVYYADKSHELSGDSSSKYILILLYLFSLFAAIEITINAAYLGYLAMLIPLTYSHENRRGQNALEKRKNRMVLRVKRPGV